jgi:iron complex transport system substrate-binding protein
MNCWGADMKNPALAGRHLRSAALVVLLWLGIASARAEIGIDDDAGNRVVLPRPATRIVSLAPHITELLFAAGANEKVVGAVEYSNYPEAASRLPRIGSHAAFDLERIAALKPDLAIVWGSGNPPGQVAQLRRLNIPVFVSEPKRLEDIPASLRAFGQLAAVPGELAAHAFEQRLTGLRSRHAHAAPVGVFYEIWNQPLMTVGGNHLISAALAVCGGRNVFGALTQSAAAIELEAVLRADPEVIVASGMDEARPEWLDHWRRWPRLKAVKNGNLFFVPPDLLQRHTPRILDGVEQLCSALDSARKRKN